MSTSFRGDMVQWVAKVNERLEQVPAEAAKELVYDVRTPISQGGHMPVVTGNLRNSVEVSFTGPVEADKEYKSGQILPDAMARVNPKLLRIKIGQSIFIGFRAIYAPKMELKHAFVRLSAQRWSQLVKDAVTTVKARTK